MIRPCKVCLEETAYFSWPDQLCAKHYQETLEDWTEEQKAAWRKGTWTPEQIDALDKESEEHIDNCEECQKGLEDPENVVYCPVGESLEETYAQAYTEYSWQPDFNPNRVIELRSIW